MNATDITCYSCIETVHDVEWVLRLLLEHLAKNGVLRLNLLLVPFLSSPMAATFWIDSRWIDLQHIPSRDGLSVVWDRLSLTVVKRSKTVNLPVVGGEAPGLLEGPMTLRKAANAFRLGLTTFTASGFGEELVLCRTSERPPDRLLICPPRIVGDKNLWKKT